MAAEQLDIFQQPAHLQAMRSMRYFDKTDMAWALGMSPWSTQLRKLFREEIKPNALLIRYFYGNRQPGTKDYEGFHELFIYLGHPVDWHIDAILEGGKWSEGPWVVTAYPGTEHCWVYEGMKSLASARAEQREDALDKLISLMSFRYGEVAE